MLMLRKMQAVILVSMMKWSAFFDDIGLMVVLKVVLILPMKVIVTHSTVIMN